MRSLLFSVLLLLATFARADYREFLDAAPDPALGTKLRMAAEATLKAYLLPIDHPLVHQLTYPRRMQLRVGDGLWVRLVDVAAALSAREYADAGAVVVELDDGFLPENGGRWRISADTVERTEDEPDLALGVGELGSVYLGGFGPIQSGSIRGGPEVLGMKLPRISDPGPEAGLAGPGRASDGGFNAPAMPLPASTSDHDSFAP